jgi:hypothetical protein
LAAWDTVVKSAGKTAEKTVTTGVKIEWKPAKSAGKTARIGAGVVVGVTETLAVPILSSVTLANVRRWIGLAVAERNE